MSGCWPLLLSSGLMCSGWSTRTRWHRSTSRFSLSAFSSMDWPATGLVVGAETRKNKEKQTHEFRTNYPDGQRRSRPRFKLYHRWRCRYARLDGNQQERGQKRQRKNHLVRLYGVSRVGRGDRRTREQGRPFVCARGAAPARLHRQRGDPSYQPGCAGGEVPTAQQQAPGDSGSGISLGVTATRQHFIHTKRIPECRRATCTLAFFVGKR